MLLLNAVAGHLERLEGWRGGGPSSRKSCLISALRAARLGSRSSLWGGLLGAPRALFWAVAECRAGPGTARLDPQASPKDPEGTPELRSPMHP